jgi:hypothetical protein
VLCSCHWQCQACDCTNASPFSGSLLLHWLRSQGLGWPTLSGWPESEVLAARIYLSLRASRFSATCATGTAVRQAQGCPLAVPEHLRNKSCNLCNEVYADPETLKAGACLVQGCGGLKRVVTSGRDSRPACVAAAQRSKSLRGLDSSCSKTINGVVCIPGFCVAYKSTFGSPVATAIQPATSQRPRGELTVTPPGQ